MYLLGEPFFAMQWRSEFMAPTGHIEKHRPILDESSSMSVVGERLRQEYAVIAHGLHRMGVSFHLVYRGETTNTEMALALSQATGCRLAGFRGFPNEAALYPRDMLSVFPRGIVLNPRLLTQKVAGNKGKAFRSSVFGEGGRMLYTDTHAVLTDSVMDEETTRPTTPEDTQSLTELDVQVGQLPLFASERFSFDRQLALNYNDHLDRVACLLHDGRGQRHLLLDPQLRFIRWHSYAAKAWEPLSVAESLEHARTVMAQLGITVHQAVPYPIPYALNMFQAHDGKVLMTSGAESLAEQVGRIVGPKRVFTTEVPVRFYPVWRYAGIRCLIGDLPLEAMRSIAL